MALCKFNAWKNRLACALDHQDVLVVWLPLAIFSRTSCETHASLLLSSTRVSGIGETYMCYIDGVVAQDTRIECETCCGSERNLWNVTSDLTLSLQPRLQLLA